MNPFKKFLNFLFPIGCIGCGKNDQYICPDCLNSVSYCLEQKHDWIISVFQYENKIIRKAIWMLKYRNKKEIAKIFAEAIYDRIIEELQDLKTFQNFTNPILIPIPISKEKHQKREYNQSELIAFELVELDQENNFTLKTNILFKIKDTKSQMEIKNRKERLNNLKNCFQVKNPDEIEGRNIIIIDDILTTGATLSEARKVLKNAGAKKIIAITVAH
jgi:competence protein ComFC